MDVWEPIKDDLCRPRFKAIEGNYTVKVLSFEDGVVTFKQILWGKAKGTHTMMHKAFIDRYDLVYRDNVIQFRKSA